MIVLVLLFIFMFSVILLFTGVWYDKIILIVLGILMLGVWAVTAQVVLSELILNTIG